MASPDSWLITGVSGDPDRPKLIEAGPIHIANSGWPRRDRNPEAGQRFEFPAWAGGESDFSILGTGVLLSTGEGR